MIGQFQKEVATIYLESWFQALGEDKQREFLVVGLGNEAGEVAEMYKKNLVHNYPSSFMKERVGEELGDVLWHLAAIAFMQGLSLEEIMKDSMRKMRRRFPERFKAMEEEVS